MALILAYGEIRAFKKMENSSKLLEGDGQLEAAVDVLRQQSELMNARPDWTTAKESLFDTRTHA